MFLHQQDLTLGSISITVFFSCELSYVVKAVVYGKEVLTEQLNLTTAKRCTLQLTNSRCSSDCCQVKTTRFSTFFFTVTQSAQLQARSGRSLLRCLARKCDIQISSRLKEPNKEGKIASRSVAWGKHKVSNLDYTDMALMRYRIAQWTAKYISAQMNLTTTMSIIKA